MYQVPNWRMIGQTKLENSEGEKIENKGSLIEPSPCTTCPRAAGRGCHKPVEPSYQTACRKWESWFRESWSIVTGAIRGTGR